MDIEAIRKKFRDSFELESNGFINPVFLNDTKIGFSARKDCDEKILRKIKILEGKKYTTLIHIILPDDKVGLESDKVPLRVRASFDLVGEDNSTYIIDDRYIKRKKFKPIDLISRDDYFYDLKTNIFYKKGKIASGSDIINEIYSLHIKPTKTWRGMYLRAKVAWKNLISYLIEQIANLLVLILLLISGRKIPYGRISRYLEEAFKKNPANKFGQTEESLSQMKIADSEVEFFGLKTEPVPIFSYSFIHLIVFVVFYFLNYRPHLLKVIFSNNFLTIIYVIFSLMIFKSFLPSFAISLIKKLDKISGKIYNREIKI
ncbi:MAG TPA: hypothetical protein P5096_00775 [Patescibacteria group bacterium]|nr:hypothetical protein [Patescibacteria group bacterium]